MTHHHHQRILVVDDEASVTGALELILGEQGYEVRTAKAAREAEALLAAMREVWSRVEGTIMRNPQARIVETVESKEY